MSDLLHRSLPHISVQQPLARMSPELTAPALLQACPTLGPGLGSLGSSGYVLCLHTDSAAACSHLHAPPPGGSERPGISPGLLGPQAKQRQLLVHAATCVRESPPFPSWILAASLGWYGWPAPRPGKFVHIYLLEPSRGWGQLPVTMWLWVCYFGMWNMPNIQHNIY